MSLICCSALTIPDIAVSKSFFAWRHFARGSLLQEFLLLSCGGLILEVFLKHNEKKFLNSFYSSLTEEEEHHMKNHLLYFTIKVDTKNPPRPYTDASFLNVDKAFSRCDNRLSNASAHRICTIAGKPTDTWQQLQPRELRRSSPAVHLPLAFMSIQQTPAAEGWFRQGSAALPELGENGPARGRNCFSHLFFQLQANELAPINEKILTRFDQLKHRVLIHRSLSSKLQRPELIAAAHYFCRGHSRGNLLGFSISSSERGSATKFLQKWHWQGCCK